jgi:hypothetical protein
MRYAIITMNPVGGAITNLIIADDRFVQEHLEKDQIAVVLDDRSHAGIGWGYVDGVFVEPPPQIWNPPEDDKLPENGDSPPKLDAAGNPI